jgi:hypothetical protein
VAHVRFYQVSRCECAVQAQFTSQDSGSNDPRKLPGVVSWIRWMSAPNAEEI